MSTPEFSFGLSDRIQRVAPSQTTQIFALAESMRCQGRSIINLAVGEPDFETPPPIIEATRKALTEGITRYGPVAGIPQLRQRLAEYFVGYKEGNILITNGAKQALFALFQVLLQAGDEIIIPAPCWVSFTEQVKLAGATPVLVETTNGQLDLERMENALTANTRAILINTPNNPTGAVYDDTMMAHVVDLASRHGLFIIADEAYHAFTYDGHGHTPLFDLCEDKTRVITVRSFSKHYNMTGYRLGYVGADTQVITALTRLQGHLSGNVCSFAQHGALAALDMNQDIVDQRRATLEQRRNLALGLVSSLFPCHPPHGAFYLFVDVSTVLAPYKTDTDLCLHLLKTAGVAVVPGSAFSGPGHLRISFGASEEELRNGIKKIKEVL